MVLFGAMEDSCAANLARTSVASASVPMGLVLVSVFTLEGLQRHLGNILLSLVHCIAMNERNSFLSNFYASIV